jgi:hypothetical protein
LSGLEGRKEADDAVRRGVREATTPWQRHWLAQVLEGGAISAVATLFVWAVSKALSILKTAPYAPVLWAFIAAAGAVAITTSVWLRRLQRVRRDLTTSGGVLHLPLPSGDFQRERLASIHMAAHGLLTICGERVSEPDSPTGWVKLKPAGPVPDRHWDKAATFGPYTAFPHLAAHIDPPQTPGRWTKFCAWFRMRVERTDDRDIDVRLNVLGATHIPPADGHANNYPNSVFRHLTQRDFSRSTEWRWIDVAFRAYGDPFVLYEYRVEVHSANCNVWVDAVALEVLE